MNPIDARPGAKFTASAVRELASTIQRNKPVAPGIRLPGGTAIEQPPEPWFVAEIDAVREEDEEENPLDPVQYAFTEVWLLKNGTTEPVTSGRTSDGYKNYALAYPGIEFAEGNLAIMRPAPANADLYEALPFTGGGTLQEIEIEVIAEGGEITVGGTAPTVAITCTEGGATGTVSMAGATFAVQTTTVTIRGRDLEIV